MPRYRNIQQLPGQLAQPQRAAVDSGARNKRPNKGEVDGQLYVSPGLVEYYEAGTKAWVPFPKTSINAFGRFVYNSEDTVTNYIIFKNNDQSKTMAQIGEFGDLAGIDCGVDPSYRGLVWVRNDETTSTEKAGIIVMNDRLGGLHYLWFDTSGQLRRDTSDPGVNDTGGTVVG